jgi:urease accessory protein UreE
VPRDVHESIPILIPIHPDPGASASRSYASKGTPFMLIARTLGTLDDESISRGPAIDWLDLTWLDCARPSLRRPTRAGEWLEFALPLGASLRHRDILSADTSRVIAVNLLPTLVLVAAPSCMDEMGRLAVELSSLHVPLEVGGKELIVLPDAETESVLKRRETRFRRDVRRFVPEPSSTLTMTLPPTEAASVEYPVTATGPSA